MTWREDLVAGVLDLLAPLSPQAADVERMPDKPSYDKFTHPRAAVWVGYHASKRAGALSVGAASQERVITFDVALLTRQLHTAKGSLNLLDAVEELVSGRRLAQGSPLLWVTDGFGGHDAKKGVWRYDIMLSVTVPRVVVPQEPADPFSYPALKFALLEDELGGDTSVGVDPDA